MRRIAARFSRLNPGDVELRGLERSLTADPADAEARHRLRVARARRGDFRARLELEVWERTHDDFRGINARGRHSIIMLYGPSGTELRELEDVPTSVLWLRSRRRDPRNDPQVGDEIIRQGGDHYLRVGDEIIRQGGDRYYVTRRTPPTVWYRVTREDGRYRDTNESVWHWRYLMGGVGDFFVVTIAELREPEVNPGHAHPRLRYPLPRETVEDELATLWQRAGYGPHRPHVVEWPAGLTRLHERVPRRYAQVSPWLEPPRFEFAEQTRWLPHQHRRGLLAHEVGHVLAPTGNEGDADLAAWRALGVRVGYDRRWPGRGLQTANPFTSEGEDAERRRRGRHDPLRKALDDERIDGVAKALDTWFRARLASVEAGTVFQRPVTLIHVLALVARLKSESVFHYEPRPAYLYGFMIQLVPRPDGFVTIQIGLGRPDDPRPGATQRHVEWLSGLRPDIHTVRDDVVVVPRTLLERWAILTRTRYFGPIARSENPGDDERTRMRARAAITSGDSLALEAALARASVGVAREALLTVEAARGRPVTWEELRTATHEGHARDLAVVAWDALCNAALMELRGPAELVANEMRAAGLGDVSGAGPFCDGDVAGTTTVGYDGRFFHDPGLDVALRMNIRTGMWTAFWEGETISTAEWSRGAVRTEDRPGMHIKPTTPDAAVAFALAAIRPWAAMRQRIRSARGRQNPDCIPRALRIPPFSLPPPERQREVVAILSDVERKSAEIHRRGQEAVKLASELRFATFAKVFGRPDEIHRRLNPENYALARLLRVEGRLDPSAHFWIQRTGQRHTVGRPFRRETPGYLEPESLEAWEERGKGALMGPRSARVGLDPRHHLAVTVLRPDVLLPDFLFYVAEYAWRAGLYQRVCGGTLQQHVRKDDVLLVLGLVLAGQKKANPPTGDVELRELESRVATGDTSAVVPLAVARERRDGAAARFEQELRDVVLPAGYGTLPNVAEVLLVLFRDTKSGSLGWHTPNTGFERYSLGSVAWWLAPATDNTLTVILAAMEGGRLVIGQFMRQWSAFEPFPHPKVFWHEAYNRGGWPSVWDEQASSRRSYPKVVVPAEVAERWLTLRRAGALRRAGTP